MEYPIDPNYPNGIGPHGLASVWFQETLTEINDLISQKQTELTRALKECEELRLGIQSLEIVKERICRS